MRPVPKNAIFCVIVQFLSSRSEYAPIPVCFYGALLRPLVGVAVLVVGALATARVGAMALAGVRRDKVDLPAGTARCALPAGPHFLLGRQKKVSKEKAMTLFEITV
jgi:hypothetical protein